MAHIVIHVTDPLRAIPGGGNDDVTVAGYARCSGMDDQDPAIEWETDPIDPSATAAAINAEIRNAAVAAADVAGYTVNILTDRQTIVGAAVGLL